MRKVGIFIQLMGTTIVVGGVMFGILLFRLNGTSLIIGGLILGFLTIGFGNIVAAVADISSNSQRSADALDRIAKAQTGVASSLPPDAAKRLQQTPIKPLSK